MADIAPELWEKIQKSFDEKMRTDPEAQAVYEKIKAGTATHAETQRLAHALAENAPEAMLEHIAEGVLPDDKMYWNIAERTVKPLMETAHAMEMSAASEIQDLLNQKAGLGIKAAVPKPPDKAIKGVLDKLAGAQNFSQVQSIIKNNMSPVIAHYGNDFVRKNVDYQKSIGLSPWLERKSRGDKEVCKFCRALVYDGDYDGAPDAIFAKHRACRCKVTFAPARGDASKKKGKQDVHTKVWSNQNLPDHGIIDTGIAKEIGAIKTPQELSALFENRYNITIDPTLLTKDFEKVKAFAAGIGETLERYPKVAENISEIQYGYSKANGYFKFTKNYTTPTGVIGITPKGIDASIAKIKSTGIHETLHAADFRMSIRDSGIYDTVSSKSMIDDTLKNLGIRKNSREAGRLQEYFFDLDSIEDIEKPYEKFTYALTSEIVGKGNKFSEELLKVFEKKYTEVG